MGEKQIHKVVGLACPECGEQETQSTGAKERGSSMRVVQSQRLLSGLPTHLATRAASTGGPQGTMPGGFTQGCFLGAEGGQGANYRRVVKGLQGQGASKC